MEPTREFLARTWAELKQGQARRLVLPLQRRLAASSDQQPELHLLLGLALESIGRRADALSQLDAAVRLAPDDARAWMALGESRSRNRDYDQAAAALRRVTAHAPDSARAWRMLGHALRRHGDRPGAMAAMHECLRIDPDDARARFELGLAHWSGGEPAAALPHVQQALAANPDNVFRIAATASIAATLDAPGRLAGRQDARRIALHMNRSFHFHILEPLFRALLPDHHVLLAAEPEFLTQFAPDVIVCADAQGSRLRELAPRATLVFVRHGLILKRHLHVATRGCDYVAGISSDYVRDTIVAAEGLPAKQLWVTGHVPMDAVFRGDCSPLPPGCLGGDRTVLYAPTWNPRLSSARLLGRDPVSALRGTDDDINVIIKPHPVMAREFADDLRLLRQGVRGRRNVWLVEDASVDALLLLPHADVLVSDASSVIMAYLALDRPLVLINHPQRHLDPGFDPDGIEWQWRDMGEEVTDVATLPRVIAAALADPGARAARRAHYRGLLYGDLTDGRAAERVAARIASLPAQTPA